MQIILTEEEYNKLKSNEKEIYDRAYKDAYDVIYEKEMAYIRDLTDLFKHHFAYYLTHDEFLTMKIRELQKKHNV